MKAIYFERTGELKDVLQLGERDKPQPQANEVRVKVLAAPINPADAFFVGGTYRFKPVFPQVAGLEGAGIVDAAGENTQLPVGSLVAFLQTGSWAEYIVVPEDALFVLPADFPVEKAAQFMINPVTAWGLLEESAVKEGEWLLVTAGNSAVSGLLVQLARRKKIKTILTVRKPQYIAGLKELGADAVIDVSQESLVQRVKDITGGEGVACALDAVGGETGTAALQCLAVNGRLIAYGRLSGEDVRVSYADLTYRFITLRGFGVRSFMARQTAAEKNDMIRSLTSLLGEKDFKMKVAATYPLHQFSEAVEAYTSGKGEGKVLLQPGV